MRSGILAFSMISVMAVAPLAAQGSMGNMGSMKMGGDPTHDAMGTGKLPENWMVKFDASAGTAPATAVSFETMAGGYHVKSGPAAVYYNTKEVGSGVYSIEATFKQTRSMEHEAFGLIIGGHNMQDSTQNYLYFVIKPSNGVMLIAHRKGWAARTKAIVPENTTTPEAAINRDAADGSATNTLLIHVAKDTVHFAINGKVVKAIAKSDLDGATTDGQTGLRINHNMDLHISGWAFKKY